MSNSDTWKLYCYSCKNDKLGYTKNKSEILETSTYSALMIGVQGTAHFSAALTFHILPRLRCVTEPKTNALHLRSFSQAVVDFAIKLALIIQCVAYSFTEIFRGM